MPVGELGPEDVETVDTDATVSDVVERFDSENVGSVVVTDGDEPVGVVTDRDVALAVNDAESVGEEDVESVMTEDPVTLQEDEPDLEASRVIDEEGVRRILIVDENGELAGIVTLDDIVAAVGEQLDNISDTIESQSPDYQP